MRTYSASEYGGDQQNRDIVQDCRGVMYVGNTYGVLEYDGVSWRQIYPGVQMSVRYLGIDATGKIWVGAAREFGCLTPDSLGFLQYNSLLAHVPEQVRKTAVRWNVAITSQGVYFQTRNALFRWSDKLRTLKTWRPENGLGESFVAEDEFYIRLTGVGLMRMEGDSLRLISDGERFAHIAILVALPFSDTKPASEAASGESADPAQKENYAATRQRLLIATPTHGLFLYDGVSFQPFKTEADALLLQNDLTCGTVLADGSYALETRYGGVAVIDRRGSLQLVLNKATGLPDNTVYKAYTDRQGGLWLALNKGLSY